MTSYLVFRTDHIDKCDSVPVTTLVPATTPGPTSPPPVSIGMMTFFRINTVFLG